MRLEDALHPKQERDRDGARGEAAAGGSSLLTDWVSDSEPVPFFYSTSA